MPCQTVPSNRFTVAATHAEPSQRLTAAVTQAAPLNALMPPAGGGAVYQVASAADCAGRVYAGVPYHVASAVAADGRV